MPAEVRPAHEHRARVDLPEWMRNPAVERPTLRRRLTLLLESRPVLHHYRRTWWAWRSRTRWAERHPAAAGVLSFLFVAAATSALLTGTLYLFHLIITGQV